MSAGSIRRQLAAEAAAAAARVSEARSAAVAHRHNLDPHESELQRSQGHRGHFRGYVFRNVRAPTPPPTRRTPTPRRRPPAPPGAGASGLDHDEQATAPPPSPGGAAAAEALFAPAFQPGPLTRHDEPGERDQEHRREEARGRQRWRIGARSEPPASPADWHAALEARAGGNAKALAPAAAGMITAASPEYRAMALVGTLLALDADPAVAAGAAGQGTALALAAVRAYLLHRAEPGPLATLARVKQALLDQRSEPRPPSPAPADPADPAVQARENRHLLRPLQLLNADRPRTEAQNVQACDRIALVCAASGMPPR
ncbi:hypothetical protein [Roseateles sp.]|uniref:hypothetical protein n=1 Tax=Roseateles sp. TaxID=1971397 RepID=UPI0031D4A5FD